MSEHPYLIGIDPGVSGAIVVTTGDAGEIVDIFDMPTVATVRTRRGPLAAV